MNYAHSLLCVYFSGGFQGYVLHYMSGPIFY